MYSNELASILLSKLRMQLQVIKFIWAHIVLYLLRVLVVSDHQYQSL